MSEEQTKAVNALGKIKKAQWKEMTNAFTSMGAFAALGGFSALIGESLGDLQTLIKGQVDLALSPLVDAIGGLILKFTGPEGLGPSIKEFGNTITDVSSDVDTFLEDLKESADAADEVRGTIEVANPTIGSFFSDVKDWIDTLVNGKTSVSDYDAAIKNLESQLVGGETALAAFRAEVEALKNGITDPINISPGAAIGVGASGHFVEPGTRDRF